MKNLIILVAITLSLTGIANARQCIVGHEIQFFGKTLVNSKWYTNYDSPRNNDACRIARKKCFKARRNKYLPSNYKCSRPKSSYDSCDVNLVAVKNRFNHTRYVVRTFSEWNEDVYEGHTSRAEACDEGLDKCEMMRSATSNGRCIIL